MSKRIRMILAAVGVFAALSIGTVFAQTSESKMAKNMANKMMDQQMMDKVDKLSVDQKAAMFDKMTEKDKMSAMKMAGHDTSKMSSTEANGHDGQDVGARESRCVRQDADGEEDFRHARRIPDG